MRYLRSFAGVVLVATPALAQTGGTFLLTASGVVTPNSPMVSIEVWAAWDDPGARFLFSVTNYDLAAGDGTFLNPTNVLNGPGSTTGLIVGNVVSGAMNGQFHVPPSINGSRDNPILLATYSWLTTDFTPRAVSVSSSNTTVFDVGWVSNGNIVSLFPQEFTPGSGIINVVPAPAAWFVLAVPFVAARRRRRS